MNRSSDPGFARSASLNFNGEIYIIETYSGYRTMMFDPNGVANTYSLDTAPNILGAALLESLQASRLISPSRNPEFFDWEKVRIRVESRENEIIKKYGYKSRRELLKNMAHVFVRNIEHIIEFHPTIHESLDGWAMGGGSDLIPLCLPTKSTPSEIGHVALRSLANCR